MPFLDRFGNVRAERSTSTEAEQKRQQGYERESYSHVVLSPDNFVGSPFSTSRASVSACCRGVPIGFRAVVQCCDIVRLASGGRMKMAA
jgi:hypothetical protein